MLGDRWLSLARAWLDEGIVERTIEPLVADWRHEQASTGGWRAATVTLRGQLAIAQSMAACFFVQLAKPLPDSVGVHAWLLGASPMVNEAQRRQGLHNRIAVILSPITLGVLGLAIARRARRPLPSAIVWWLVTPAAWSLMLAGANSEMHRTAIAHLGPWVPHAVSRRATRGGHPAPEGRAYFRFGL